MVRVETVTVVDADGDHRRRGRRAGWPDADRLRAELARPRTSAPTYRVRLTWAARTRVALRESADLTDDGRRGPRRQARAAGPGQQPRAVDDGDPRPDPAPPAAPRARPGRELGRETRPFKIDVRKLKNLGLTRSFAVGYEVSPRGLAYLERDRPHCRVADHAPSGSLTLPRPPRSSGPAAVARIGAAEIEDDASYDPRRRRATTRAAAGHRATSAHWPCARYLDGGVRRHRSRLQARTAATSSTRPAGPFDWTLDATSEADRRMAKAVHSTRIFATDADGNTDALARRMGIMYAHLERPDVLRLDQFEPEPYLSSCCHVEEEVLQDAAAPRPRAHLAARGRRGRDQLVRGQL